MTYYNTKHTRKKFARPHALKLASLTFKNLMRGQLVASVRYKSDACGNQNEAYLY